MNEYEIHGTGYLVHNGKLYVECKRAGEGTEPQPAPAESEVEEQPTRRGKKKGASKGPRKQSGRTKDDAEMPRLVRMVDAGEMKAKHAAKELGISLANYYYRAKQYKKRNGMALKASSDEKPHLTEADIAEKVRDMQAKGIGSFTIARDLRITLQTVNKYWNHDISKLPTGKLPPDEDEGGGGTDE